MIKVNVNLFSESGKWKYGGIVELSGYHLWTSEFKQELVNNQNFVADGVFDHYFVVVTHRDDYDTDPSPYFCQHMFKPGSFGLYRKEPK